MTTTLRRSALKRYKDTYKAGAGVILPPLERHVMRSLSEEPDDRASDVLHPSEMSDKEWCSRHDFYRITEAPFDKTSQRNPSFRMTNVLAEGHTIHDKYQTWLWDMGVLFGWWRCLNCENYWEALSPRACPLCSSTMLRYREVPLRRSVVAGHSDGAVHDLNDWTGLMEIKSIGLGTIKVLAPRLYNLYESGELTVDTLWWRIQRPFASHLRQGQLYLWQTWPKYEQIVYIYESKFHQQTKEFVITYNPSLIAPLLEQVREVEMAIKTGLPPGRPVWAEEPDSPVCKSCGYRSTCWGLETPDAGNQEADTTPVVIVQRASSYRRRKSLRGAATV